MPLVQPALAARVGQMLVQAEDFRKKFRIPPNQQLRVPLNHAASFSSSHFGHSERPKSTFSGGPFKKPLISCDLWRVLYRRPFWYWQKPRSYRRQLQTTD